MKANDQLVIKTILLEQKSAILNKTAEFRDEQLRGTDRVSEEAETAALDFTMAVSIQLHERDRIQLLQIENALHRIDQGTFGVCECCGEQIGERRLKVRPLATLCIECMENREDNRTH